MFKTVPVRFFTDQRWAPCDVLAQILDEDLLARVKAIVRENGGSIDPVSLLRDPNDFALLTWEDAEIILGDAFPAAREDLSHGWPAVVEMDPWEAAALYGYDVADELQRRAPSRGAEEVF